MAAPPDPDSPPPPTPPATLPAPDPGEHPAREALGDFAPALLLLPATERARVRTLLAYACTLLACAGQQGVEEERLAQIDRWEAGLERALGGETGTPPICLRMARENARRRWPADALDELAACARRRVLRPRPATAADAGSDARSLARAVGGALLETSLNAEVSGFAGALVRLHALQHLGAALARGRCPLPADEGESLVDEALGEAVQRECARLRPWLLRAPRGLVELPVPYRRAGVFSLLAALRLLSDVEEAGARLLAAPPHLPPATRILLLARARWFGLRFGMT
jgi:phytoene/squalene synthetase